MIITLKNSIKYQDIVLDHGVIVSLNSVSSIKPDLEIDASQLTVWPGLVDPHVHMRYPGEELKEGWHTGTHAALAGGTTGVLDMPNNHPPILHSGTLADKAAHIAEQTSLDVRLAIAATDASAKQLMEEYATHPGAIQFVKVFMGASTGNLAVTDPEILENLFAELDVTFLIHAEDHSTLVAAQAKLQHDDPTPKPAIHSQARPTQAALIAIEQAVRLAKQYNRKVHICHVSTRAELDIVAQAKRDGVQITCEVTPHHLWFDTSAYRTLGNKIKVNPPIREKDDVEAMWEGLASGLIDIVATDHAPHLLAEKQLPYWEVPSGVPGLEFRLPLLLTGMAQGRLDLAAIERATVSAPAALLGLTREITEGASADLVAFNPTTQWQVGKQNIYTKVGWSPYEGEKLTGQVVFTAKGKHYFSLPA